MSEKNANELVITRELNASRELVFKTFTELEHLKEWWGPKGFKFSNAKLDLRPGGIFHYCMTSPEGHEMWGIFKYIEIIAPEKVIFTNGFADAEGNFIRAPFSPTWPLQVLNTWTFTEKNGKTLVELRGIPYNATEEETAMFTANFGNMNQGFAGTLEQWEQHLSTVNV